MLPLLATDITPTSGFSTKVAPLSLITVNRCDLGAVATLHFRRTMSSTLWVFGSRGSSPMEDFETRCCPATMGAPLHSVPAMHRSRTARSALRGRFAANPRVWRLEHQVISCSHPASTDITPTSGFSTKVAPLSLITVNRCDLDTVATLHLRRTMSSTLRVLGSR